MKLLNGDSYELIKDIPSKSIDLVIIDPPYQFDNGGSGGAFGASKRDYHEQIIDLDTNKTIDKKDSEVWQEEYQRVLEKTGDKQRAKIWADKRYHRLCEVDFVSKGFTNEILDELVRVMKKINIYVWCSKAQIKQIWNYFDDLGCNLEMLTWHKTNPIPTCNNTYLSDTEYLIFAREKGVKVYGSYETKRKFYVTQINTKDKKLYEHPTIKPLDIIKNLVINSSQEGELVLDCFMGSGTTGVACKQLNRDFIGIELDKHYYEIACNRINEKPNEFNQLSLLE